MKRFFRKIYEFYLRVPGIRPFLSRSAVIALPYGWHILFFLIPFAIVIKLSFSESLIDIPPYTAVLEWLNETVLQLKLNLVNYLTLFEDDLYLAAYLESLIVAGIATFFCLLIGYPIAYGIARAHALLRIVLLMLVILPFWTSFLIRVYAWIGLLNYHGIINNLLMSLGIISEPLSLIHNHFSVTLGIVYSYLPFMILPLYAALDKMNPILIEAAYDLGCRPFKAFLMVTLPLSMKGVVAGSMLVFIPAIGEFVIPELLGGSDTLMIGKVLWTEFFNNRDWPMAAALAVALLVFLVLPIIFFQRLLSRYEEGGS